VGGRRIGISYQKPAEKKNLIFILLFIINYRLLLLKSYAIVCVMNEEATETTSKPRWYSIKEAAEYLDIGEPTLYRWMRENKITFRKVGDSTRFWREDLDAVMQVFHSERDIADVRQVCSNCHLGRMVEGVFRTTGLNYFQPSKTKFWTLKASNIPAKAYICDRCGWISLFGDTAKLAALMEKKKESAPPPSAGTSATP
jgi:excisionase family DNA binding protein